MSERRPRILIVRLSALGDVIMASGLIPALRALHPQAHIAWLTEPAAAPLLTHNPRVDEVIVWPRGQWLRLWRERRLRALGHEFARLVGTLRARRFDLALDVQGLLKSALWARLAGAPRRIGLRAREGSRWLVTETLDRGADEAGVIGGEYRSLARHLGAPAGAFRLDLAVGEAARATALDRLAQAGAGGALVALCPFTTRAQKHWFEERWAELAERLAHERLTPVLLGGPGDTEAAQRIAAASPHSVNMVGRLALDESVAVIASSRLLIGVDTGLTHAGTAFGIPTIALFGSTRPYTTAGPQTVVLYEALDCSPCRRHPTCNGAFHCMRAHSVDGVLARATWLLAQAS